jgi:hypothetical protein
MGRTALAVVLAFAFTVAAVGDLRADPPTVYQPVAQESFRPLPQIVDFGDDRSHPPRPPLQAPEPPVKTSPIDQQAPSRGASITGIASWYCKAGISVCHYAYPAGSMVAAACGKLRRAIGPDWRGNIVTVKSGNRTVIVKLVDWCGSATKLIDLYWEPMRRLGGTGVLPVKVSW